MVRYEHEQLCKRVKVRGGSHDSDVRRIMTPLHSHSPRLQAFLLNLDSHDVFQVRACRRSLIYDSPQLVHGKEVRVSALQLMLLTSLSPTGLSVYLSYRFFPTSASSCLYQRYRDRDAQHGRSIHGMILCVKMHLNSRVGCLTNHPGLRNPRLSKEPFFRRRPHSSPFPIYLSSVDCQKTYSAD